MKYTPTGSVSVRARLLGAPEELGRGHRRRAQGMDDPSAAALLARAPRSGIWVALQVIDSGVGIAATDLTRIFDEFEQVNRRSARLVLPDGDPPPAAGPVRQVREADGLEPILRLAAVWQRVDEAPLRQTQQGTLYKRDRERLEDDPVLAGPIADALEPLPDMAAALARPGPRRRPDRARARLRPARRRPGPSTGPRTPSTCRR